MGSDENGGLFLGRMLLKQTLVAVELHSIALKFSWFLCPRLLLVPLKELLLVVSSDHDSGARGHGANAPSKSIWE